MAADGARIVASRRKRSSSRFKEKTFNIADAAVINARFYRLICVYVAAAGKSMLNFHLLQQERARR
jgi:hypothetical protein